jgi:hypothetical protein
MHLIGTIRQKGARGIYWLQDYYPNLLRGYIRYPWDNCTTGRKIVASGFAGPMLAELNAANALTQSPRPEDWLPLFKSA